MLVARFRLPAFCLLLALTTTAAHATKTIELILDASGSMNAALSGSTRIAVAKQAVGKVVGSLPADTVLAFRAYGHQSPREKHDCRDTQLLVPFGPLGGARDAVVRAANGVRAQGYTPISHVLQLAAKDLAGSGAGERVIILVSDGKETCDTDPCAVARALKQADVQLVVHAIGFNVDTAARGELECIAAATGGSYRDAAGADDLAGALGQAAVATMQTVKPMATEPGNLKVERADLAGHSVRDATSGAEVATISSLKDTVKVPAGIYNVSFGAGVWRGVTVKPGASTVLSPAVLEIEGAGLNGHQVLDTETRAKIAEVSSIKSSVTVLPGLYDITFGETTWPNVKLQGGAVTKLRPGRLTVEGASFNGHKVFDSAGREIGAVSSMGRTIPLPPGSYTVEIGGKKVPFTLAEGQQVSLSAK